MNLPTRRWTLGMIYVVTVALVWIAASFVVQSVVDSGVSPFLITYICNSLFVIYIPIVEAGRYVERSIKRNLSKSSSYEKLQEDSSSVTYPEVESENILGGSGEVRLVANTLQHIEVGDDSEMQGGINAGKETVEDNLLAAGSPAGINKLEVVEAEAASESPINALKYSTTKKTALIAGTICPFWFLAQLTFNLSLKYTTVTSNTVLSTTSSLFTFAVSLIFLGERFSWIKLVSVIMCMMGSIIVSVGDSWKGNNEVATKPLLGDILCVVSAMFYATYTALIRAKMPGEEVKGPEKVSTALMLGYLGLFNCLFLAPVALLLHFSGVEPFQRLSPTQFGLIVAKGFFDNVFSDYLWAQAVLLTTPTAATAGLTIQVPIAAVVDSIRGYSPSGMDIIGGVAVLIGFFGINQSVTDCCNELPPEADSTVRSIEI